MVFTVFEVIDIVLMSLIIGFLFKDSFRAPERKGDILDQYRRPALDPRHARWNDFWWAVALIAPAIVLHELAHKFSALSFGLDATFHAACSTSDIALGGSFFSFACNLQLLAVLLKLMGFGFLIFIPGYVSISGPATHLQQALISFVGPAVHLVFWLGLAIYFRTAKKARRGSVRKREFLFFFKQINMLLFILNMLPIPGFDGFWVFLHLFRAFF